MKFKESELAHKWLDPLSINGCGIECGGSAHNPFNIANTINLDYTASLDTIFKQEEIKLCGEALSVDVVALADDIPFEDSHFDFLINSHIFEHMPNPVGCLQEWHRVVKPGGIIFSIIPLRDALESDKNKPITTLEHQLEDYAHDRTVDTHEYDPADGKYGHLHVYTLESYLALIILMNKAFGDMLEILETENPDQKVANGFAIVHKVLK
jgi:ubiquinone/menaquinone biosynthesis C-methylase UbiE